MIKNLKPLKEPSILIFSGFLSLQIKESSANGFPDSISTLTLRDILKYKLIFLYKIFFVSSTTNRKLNMILFAGRNEQDSPTL